MVLRWFSKEKVWVHLFMSYGIVNSCLAKLFSRVQEVCESRGGRPELSVLTSFTVSVDVKQHSNHAHALVTVCP